MSDPGQIDPPSWQTIDHCVAQRLEIATALRQASHQSAGPVRRQLAYLSKWFGQPISRDDVLQTAPALMLCLAYGQKNGLTDQEAAWGMVSEPAGRLDGHRLEDAVRVVADSLAQRPASGGLRALLVYPASLLAGCVIVSAFISTEIIPPFQEMFDSFGLLLPVLTQWLFVAAWLVRASLLPLLVIVVLGAAIHGVLLPILRRRSGHWRQPLPLGSSLARQRWADWAEHVSLLLQTGLPLRQSCQIADGSPAASRLPNVTVQRPERPASAERPAPSSDPVGVGPADIDPADFDPADFVQAGVLWPAYQQLASALTMPSGDKQIAKLQAVVGSYRDRQRGTMANLAVWLTPVFTIVIMAILALVVLGLFMPLIRLMSGISGLA